MMPFSTPDGYEEGHFAKIYEQIIKPSIEKAGLKAERVDENLLSTDIVTKIFKGITECDMAICDLSSKNPNVLYELGIRQAYNKPVLLIKDEKTEKIFDVGGLTTIPYNSHRLYENVNKAIGDISTALNEVMNNRESVVNIIRARLGSNFKSSEIPNQKDMDNNQRVVSLLYSLIEDVDLIKKNINSKRGSENKIDIYNNRFRDEIIYLEELYERYSRQTDKLSVCRDVKKDDIGWLKSLLNQLRCLINSISNSSDSVNLSKTKNEIDNVIIHLDRVLKNYGLEISKEQYRYSK